MASRPAISRPSRSVSTSIGAFVNGLTGPAPSSTDGESSASTALVESGKPAKPIAGNPANAQTRKQANGVNAPAEINASASPRDRDRVAGGDPASLEANGDAPAEEIGLASKLVSQTASKPAVDRQKKTFRLSTDALYQLAEWKLRLRREGIANAFEEKIIELLIVTTDFESVLMRARQAKAAGDW